MIKMFVARKSPLDVNKAHSGDDEEDGEDAHDGDKPGLCEQGLHTGHGELGGSLMMAGGRGHAQTNPLTERSHAGPAIMIIKIKYHRYGREELSRIPSGAY